MSFTLGSKEILAKLMATENVIIHHRKVKTASFDIKNRILSLPIWRDISSELYDLLTGHEVGHALYTPEDGWMEVVNDETAGKGYRFFVNVIEDARIEKKIQRLYPGLRNSFKLGHNELFDRGFFGVIGEELDDLFFIDRLNIYTKSQYSRDIKFNDIELGFVKRAKELETWTEVISLANDIYEYSKKEQKEKIDEVEDDSPKEFTVKVNEFGEENDGEVEVDIPDTYGKEELESGSDSDSATEEDEDDDPKDGDCSGDGTGGDSENDEPFEPTCETERAYDRNQYRILDDTCKDFLYLDIPTPNLDRIITPHNVVQGLLSEEYEHLKKDQYYIDLIKNFRVHSDRYVGLLAKEFEMKKAATCYNKSRISRTGDINIEKIYDYKLDDNIFKRLKKIPQGKSHGVVLLLDASGSMTSNMAGSLEQLIILALFCQKVQIPFVVYSFNNHKLVFSNDVGEVWDKYFHTKGSFSRKENEVNMLDVRMREYINSNMSRREFNEAISNLIMLKLAYTYKYGIKVPASESLNSTPLNSALIASVPILKDIKKKYNLECMSLIIVHDGDSDNSPTYFTGDYKLYGPRASIQYNTKATNVYFQDKKIHFQMKCENETVTILEWFKRSMDVNVIGFYIINPGVHNFTSALTRRYHKKGRLESGVTENERKVLYEFMDTHNFIVSNNPGYDKFYIVQGGSKMMYNDEFEVDDGMSMVKIKNAFIRRYQKRKISRALVSSFIDTLSF
jgi:hypothetical protein